MEKLKDRCEFDTWEEYHKYVKESKEPKKAPVKKTTKKKED